MSCKLSYHFQAAHYCHYVWLWHFLLHTDLPRSAYWSPSNNLLTSEVSFMRELCSDDLRSYSHPSLNDDGKCRWNNNACQLRPRLFTIAGGYQQSAARHPINSPVARVYDLCTIPLPISSTHSGYQSTHCLSAIQALSVVLMTRESRKMDGLAKQPQATVELWSISWPLFAVSIKQYKSHYRTTLLVAFTDVAKLLFSTLCIS